MSLADKLRKARKKSGLTQIEVANLLDITKAAYSGYETGRREPDALKIKALAQIFGVSGDELLETGLGDDAIKKESQQEENLQKLSGKEVISKFVVAAGLIQEGQQLSEADYKILNNVMDILETWFRQKGKE